MININDLPESYSLFTFFVKEIDDLDDMCCFIRKYLRYNYGYINPINYDEIFDENRPVDNNDITTSYYIKEIDLSYKLYYRVNLNINRVDDYYRYVLYKDHHGIKYDNTFKEYGYYFNTFDEAVEYVDHEVNSDAEKITISPRCLILYDNVIIDNEYYIILVTSYMFLKGHIVFFNTRVWDVDLIRELLLN